MFEKQKNSCEIENIVQNTSLQAQCDGVTLVASRVIRGVKVLEWSMDEYVVVEHLPQPQLCAAQSALHKAAKQGRADQNATTQASRQSWREPACRLAVFSKRTEKSNLSGVQKYTIPHSPQSSLVFSWRDARRICLFFQSQLDKAQLFPSFFNALRIYILCGVRVVFQEHGALGICKSSVWT